MLVAANWRGAAPSIPDPHVYARPAPVAWCRAPPLAGFGSFQDVTLDLTLNGQARAPRPNHGRSPSRLAAA